MKIDKQTADAIVAKLAGAVAVLEQGRAYGIQVMATEEAINGLSQSSHPETERVVANLFMVNNIPS